MSSIFSHSIWSEQNRYVTPQADFAHHGFDPGEFEMGKVCLITFSSSLFDEMLKRVTVVEDDF